MPERIMPDSSTVINGEIVKQLEKEEIKDAEIVIPIIVLEELQAQASRGKETGFIGLKELKKLRTICDGKGIPLTFIGERPKTEDIRLARSGRLDALIIDASKRENCTLLTSDYVQALAAEAQGVKVRYIKKDVKIENLRFERYFTHDTLSVHLKEGVHPLAKRGRPGKFELVKISNKPLSTKEIEDMIGEVFEAVRMREGFFEINRNGAVVIQLGNYRLAVARQPFSDGVEVTIVRPIVKLRLEDYKLSHRLMQRFSEKSEGILIAGPPGSGKSTFASSLAEFYLAQNRIVKTLESPRDLQVDPKITQYGPLEGSFEKAADILLLVRPDYTFFDELRKTKDFEVFADMRLAGVGMVGVVHASDPIDAIQRFIGRVELGIIPHIVDTLIFLRYGEIEKIYELNLTVKVPSGMTEEDLARPIIEVIDFESGKIDYEIYTFGNENVVIPLTTISKETSPVARLAEEKIFEEIKRHDPYAIVEASGRHATVKVSRKTIPRLIGKDGVNISRLEKKLGIKIDVRPREEKIVKEIKFDIQETRNTINLIFGDELIGRTVNIYSGDNFLFSAIIGKKGLIRIAKKSIAGEVLIKAFNERNLRILF